MSTSRIAATSVSLFILAGGALFPFLSSAQTSGTGLLNVYVQVLNGAQNGLPVHTPADFTVTVSGQNPSPATFQGSLNGTLVSLGAGSYSTVVANAFGYTPVYSVGCTNTMASGQNSLCVITMSGSASYWGPPTPYPYPYYNNTLTCAPAYQTVAADQAVTFSASGGIGPFNWTTTDRTYLNVGPTLNTILQTLGSQTVIVSNGTQTATCTVNVVSGGVAVTYGTPSVTSTYFPALPNTGFAPQDGATLAFALVMLLGSAVFAFPYVKKTFAVVTR